MKDFINIGIPSKGRLKIGILEIFKKKKLKLISERGERDLIGSIKNKKNIKMTTIVGIRKDNLVVIAGDGQASFGNTVMKPNVKKIRRLGQDDSVISGFAGSTADAFALFERLESKLDQYKNQLMRACVELAKDWRTDRYLRRLEAMMIVANKDVSLLLSGTGDVIESDDGILAIGSGGPFANSAAKALLKNTKMNAKDVAIESLNIAADICIYTNHNIISETIEL